MTNTLKMYTAALAVALAASQAVSAHTSQPDHTHFARLTRLQQGISNLLHRGIDKCAPLADGLPTSTVNKIKANLAGSADINSIWVVGTQMEALTEYDYPSLTVFDERYFTNIQSGSPVPAAVNSLVDTYLGLLKPNDTEFAVIAGGASADPVSLGQGWINAALTTEDQDKKEKLLTYADRQVAYILQEIPRQGKAISHRPISEPAQLWDDFSYMVPPTFAYYGALLNNHTVLVEAFNQIAAYRELMRDEKSGLWVHIKFGWWEDLHLWGTGMAWTVAGMTRVLATYKHTPVVSLLLHEQIKTLKLWINELVAAMLAQIRSDDLLPNVFSNGEPSTNPDEKPNFSDTATSALVAATVYRLAQMNVLDNRCEALATAEKIRKAVYEKLDPDTAWLNSATDPLQWYTPISESPESMAFAILMEAAARDLRL